MKKLLLAVVFYQSAWAANPDIKPSLEGIYDHVIVPNAEQSVASCQALKASLQLLKPGTENSVVKPGFSQLVGDWKRVQALYVAGNLDEDYLDTPSAIDIFHNGKEDIHAQMDHALASDSPANKALFKYSQRTVNALEYVLFTQPKLDQRHLAFANYITDSICSNLNDIATVYKQNRAKFIGDQDRSLAHVVHSLSMSIFSTKDWRIGDVAGITRKYKDKPDYRRSEYGLSGANQVALKAIFSSHQQVLTSQSYPNLVQVLEIYKAPELVKTIDDDLQKMQQRLDQLSPDTVLADPARTQTIYVLGSELYRQYYISMMSALPVVQQVLDADGD